MQTSVVCQQNDIARAMEVHFLPLVPNAVMPIAAPASTRSPVPPGYGVQEQCLPFTAATALGLLVRSPITFGLCRANEVPQGGHPFRSPVNSEATEPSDPRVFYVLDDTQGQFSGNAFTFEASGGGVVPGLSFFDRADQHHLFKVHLPYLCRTAAGIDTLFVAPINRTAPFDVLSGLVETDWYSSPVNLILRKPPAARSVHVMKGAALAQLVFLDRACRRPSVRILPDHAKLSRDLKVAMRGWDRQHHQDRSAYKKLARTSHGRLDGDTSPTNK